MAKVELSEKEIALLLQSLDHCLATCHNKSANGGPCSDCEAAKKLRDRLAQPSGH